MHISGFGSLLEIEKIITYYSPSNILLVTGKRSFKSSGVKKKIDDCLNGYKKVYFRDFETNPKLEDAIIGAKLAEKNSIDLILSIGGGSVIDMAKLIKAFYGKTNRSKKIIYGQDHISNNSIPLVAIPTTAGSGSESTHFAVVYLNNEKFSLADMSLLPSSTILDGSLCISASKYQKACNVLDALSQSIESAWAVNASSQSRNFAYRALEICTEVSKNFVNEDSSFDYCQQMIEASNLAGKAINISKTTSAHAWSYGFSTKYNIPHGHAVWLTLPKIFKIHCLSDFKKMHDENMFQQHKKVMKKIKEILSIKSNEEIENYFYNFLKSLGIDKITIDDFHLSSSQKIDLSKAVNIERMKNNPIIFSEKDVQEIFMLN